MVLFTTGSSPVTQVVPGAQIVFTPPQILASAPQLSNVIGIVGTASWGPLNTPVPVSTPVQTQGIFGPTVNRLYDLGFYVNVAYINKASNFVLVRTDDSTSVAASGGLKVSTDSAVSATATALYPGALGNNITISISTGSKANTLKATVTLPGIGSEVYNNLPSTAGSFWANLIAAVNLGAGSNTASQILRLSLGTPTTAPTAGLYWNLSGTSSSGATVISPVTGIDATAYSGITTTTLVGASSGATGMYALDGKNVNHLVLADAFDSTQWTTIDSFASSNGMYAHLAGPAGQTVSAAVSTKTTAGLDSSWSSLSFGDWPTFSDPVNGTTRQISPSILKAARLAAQSPNDSSLNKPLYGILQTQRSGNYVNGLSSYSRTETATLIQAGIDLINSPSAGGTFYGFQRGCNSSSNAAINGDNWPQMSSLIARTMGSFVGIYVGTTVTDDTFFNVTTALNNALGNLVAQRWLNDGSYEVVCDASNNPPSAISVGILTANVKVRYQSIILFFNLLLEGGQGVVINVNTSASSVGISQSQVTIGV